MADEKLISYKDVDTKQEYNIDKDSQSGLSIDRKTFSTPATSSNPSFSTNIGESIAKYREENPVNVFSEDVKKPTSGVERIQKAYTSPVHKPEDYENEWKKYLEKHPEHAKYKETLDAFADVESKYKNVPNNAGANSFGYFQVNEINLKGIDFQEFLNDPQMQISKAIEVLKNNISTFTDEDWKKGEELGHSRLGMLAGAWLGGVGGVRNLIHRGIDADDRHHSKKGLGESISHRMDTFRLKEGGAVNTKRFPIKISGKTYNIKIAETEEDKSIGLSEKDTLPKDEGMLFMISEEDKDKEGLIWFTMEDTKIPLDIVFIDDNFEVLQVSKGEPLSEEPVYGKGSYVLEVNPDSEIIVGDELEFKTDKKVNNKMMVLDVEGNAQMTLDGGERIFSIKNTKILIKFAKKSTATKKDNDYKALGKRVFKFLEIQDSNEAEYV